MPEKRRKEAQERTKRLFQQARTLSPSFDHLEKAFFDAGIDTVLLHRIAKTLYDQEGLRPPILPPVGDDPINLARYQDVLETFINNAQPDHYERFERKLIAALSLCVPLGLDGDEMFISERKRSKQEIEKLMLRFVNDDSLFKPLVDQLDENFRDEGEVYPTKSKYDDYAWRYLKDTPLLDLAEATDAIPLSDRMYHTYLLGSSGSGKTNLIDNIIAHDLKSDEDCCVVVIDSAIDRATHEERKRTLTLEFAELREERTEQARSDLSDAEIKKFLELITSLIELHILLKPDEKRYLLRNCFSNLLVQANEPLFEPHSWHVSRDFGELTPLVTHPLPRIDLLSAMKM